MLILILINVQYLQIVVFSLKKGLNDQKHFSLDFNHPMKQSPFPPTKLIISPLTIISDFLIPPLSHAI